MSRSRHEFQNLQLFVLPEKDISSLCIILQQAILSNLIYMLQITHQIYIPSPEFPPEIGTHNQLLLDIVTWKFIEYLKVMYPGQNSQSFSQICCSPHLPVSVNTTITAEPLKPKILDINSDSSFFLSPHRQGKNKSCLPYFKQRPSICPLLSTSFFYHLCAGQHHVSSGPLYCLLTRDPSSTFTLLRGSTDQLK